MSAAFPTNAPPDGKRRPAEDRTARTPDEESNTEINIGSRHAAGIDRLLAELWRGVAEWNRGIAECRRDLALIERGRR